MNHDKKEVASNSSDTLPENQGELFFSSKVGEYIKDVMKKRNEEIKMSEIAEITGISKSYLYQIIPARDTPPKIVKDIPNRKMILAVALALNFSLDETQQLLNYANETELCSNNKFDAVIIYSLEKKYSVVKTNILLYEKNCELLIFED